MWIVDCSSLILEHEGSISLACFHGWLPNYCDMCIALPAWWMGQFLCTWCYWRGCCMGVSQVYPKVYVGPIGQGVLQELIPFDLSLLPWSTDRDKCIHKCILIPFHSDSENWHITSSSLWKRDLWSEWQTTHPTLSHTLHSTNLRERQGPITCPSYWYLDLSSNFLRHCFISICSDIPVFAFTLIPLWHSRHNSHPYHYLSTFTQ